MKFHNPLAINLGCGGTILDSKTILTAAHCEPRQQKRIFIEAGITNLLGGHGQAKFVESFTAHQDYNPCEFV